MSLIEIQCIFLNLFTYFLQLSSCGIICWIYGIAFILLFLISSFGQQLGIRQKYIHILLKIFEFGSDRVKKKTNSETNDEPEEPETPNTLNNVSYVPVWEKTLKQEVVTNKNGFHLHDILPFLADGISTIVNDAVTPHFISEELPYWNLLSRTNNRAYEFVSFRLTAFWLIGFIIRYFLLLPVRLIILMIGIIVFFSCTLVLGLFSDSPFKRHLNSKISITCFDFVAGCLSLVATFHNAENMPKSGIAVANHTSPIDSMILATDNCYDMVGQKHGGLLGIFMNILSRSSFHIWFERSESKDRNQVVKRLKDHASNPDLPPVLIFPEGVCVNNTSVMQFRKGAFEVADVIYPIAIKFDSRLGDPFWWQDHFYSYALYMMTSWAIVCDVWYLPPMHRLKDETPISFAKRVKAAIAQKGGLTDVSWDGFLKVAPVKEEWRQMNQLAFAQQILGDCPSTSLPSEEELKPNAVSETKKES